MHLHKVSQQAFAVIASIAAVELTVVSLLCLFSPFLAILYATTHVVDLYHLSLTVAFLVAFGVMLLWLAWAIARRAEIVK